jgi:hypothetical protein
MSEEAYSPEWDEERFAYLIRVAENWREWIKWWRFIADLPAEGQ